MSLAVIPQHCGCQTEPTRITWTQEPLPFIAAGYGEAKTYVVDVCDLCWTARVISITSHRPTLSPAPVTSLAKA